MLFLGLISLLAFYLAWNLGANDVANSMGTSVGSKAVTLRQALVIAGVLEFTGAVLFGQGVSETLATDIVNPDLFAQAPQVLLLGMVSVLISCGLWLQIATAFGLPVSSSHAVVGALAGFGWAAIGPQAVDWASIRIISLTWIITPVISGSIAALFYSLVKRWILDQPNPISQLREWIPWLSSALFGAFGIIVLPSLSQPLQALIAKHLGFVIPTHDLSIAGGAIAAMALTFNSWQQLERSAEFSVLSSELSPAQNLNPSSQALQSPAQNSKLKTQKFSPIERQMARFQLLSACFVAFAHGSNDVGNAVAPLAAIAYIHHTGSVPSTDFSVPLWILVLGGVGIVAGLAVWGKKVIATIGEGITTLRPSGGFCAELATATTILLASRFGLPVSTSHALVGGVIGIGLVQSLQSRNSPSSAIRFKTLQNIALAWLITIPIAASLGASIFALARLVWFQ